MRPDIVAQRGFLFPEFEVLEGPALPSFRSEWTIAGLLTVVWVAALGTYGAGYFGVADGLTRQVNFIEVVVYVAALLVPLMCLWCGTWVVSQTKAVREDAASLREAVNELERALSLASPASTDIVVSSVKEAAQSAMKAEQARITSQIRNLSEDQRQTSEAVRQLLKTRGQEHAAISELVETAKAATEKAAQKAVAVDAAITTKSAQPVIDPIDQDDLPLDAPRGAIPADVAWSDINRALDFPTDADDADAFAAIRAVFPDRNIGQLLKRAEAVLAMLAEEGIYMDDLDTKASNPELWRSLANGARGKSVEAIGTITDPSAIALARGRMRSDAEFREASLDFLRRFETFLKENLARATTPEILDLADNRTGRAFQLLARVTGAFD